MQLCPMLHTLPLVAGFSKARSVIVCLCVHTPTCLCTYRISTVQKAIFCSDRVEGEKLLTRCFCSEKVKVVTILTELVGNHQ